MGISTTRGVAKLAQSQVPGLIPVYCRCCHVPVIPTLRGGGDRGIWIGRSPWTSSRLSRDRRLFQHERNNEVPQHICLLLFCSLGLGLITSAWNFLWRAGWLHTYPPAWIEWQMSITMPRSHVPPTPGFYRIILHSNTTTNKIATRYSQTILAPISFHSTTKGRSEWRFGTLSVIPSNQAQSGKHP